MSGQNPLLKKRATSGGLYWSLIVLDHDLSILVTFSITDQRIYGRTDEQGIIIKHEAVKYIDLGLHIF